MAVVMAATNDGNFTTSSTWHLVDATSYLNAENATESLLTTAYSGTRSSAFAPGAIEIDGIAVKLCERLGTTGTMSVELYNSTDAVAVTGTEVTINVSDLPNVLETDADGGWIFFKFASPVTLEAAHNYNVEAKTSSSNMVDLWCDGTADNLSRCLRTTTDQAPTTSDDMIITGEKTGAGAQTTINVVMNETATTDYGSAPTAANSLITPGLSICSGGTLTYGTTATTNYYLKMSNSIIVYSGGTLNIGTTGTPIPRDSTAVLEFDCGADGDYGLIIRNGGTFNSQGLSRTSGKNIVKCKLNTDEAINSTSLGVDTDTGWKDNDVIAIAGTPNCGTFAGSEKGTLNGDAGASTLTVDGFGGAGGGLANAHLGTSPRQAHIALLTRNVKIRGASATLMAYVDIKAVATVDIDWTEFTNLGEDATNKRGVDIKTSTGNCNIAYSSFYDFEDYGIYASGSANITISNCNTYRCCSTLFSGYGLYITGTSTVDNHLSILDGGSNTSSSKRAVYINSLQVTFTNNVIANATDGGLYITGTTPGGTFTNNEIYTNAYSSNYGLWLSTCGSQNGAEQLFTSFKVWQNGTSTKYGISISSAYNLRFVDCSAFGNNGYSIGLGTVDNITLDNFTSSGCTSNATTDGLRFGGHSYNIKIYNSSFGAVSGIYTAHTNDININSAYNIGLVLNSVKLASTTEVANLSNLNNLSFIKSSKHDQTSGTHKSWFRYGIVQTDTAANMYRTASPSEKLTPNSATYKLESGSKKVSVANGETVTISVYVRESVSGDGTDYNGNRPRLILKRNDAIGITADTVIDTATASAEGAFEQLTGTTAATTDDGVMEFVVDCDGTTGWVNVDDWSVT